MNVCLYICAFADNLEATTHFFDFLRLIMTDQAPLVVNNIGRWPVVDFDRRRAQWAWAAKLWRAAGKPLPVEKQYLGPARSSIAATCRMLCRSTELLPLVAVREGGCDAVHLGCKIEEMCCALFFSCVKQNEDEWGSASPQGSILRASVLKTMHCEACSNVLLRHMPVYILERVVVTSSAEKKTELLKDIVFA